MMIEDMKNKIFNKIESNDNSFEKIYYNYKNTIDNFLDNAKDKIQQIPEKDNNNYLNNEDPLTKEIHNLRFQKTQADKTKKVFTEIKNDYIRLKIDEKKDLIDNLVIKNEKTFNISEINNFFKKIENNFQISLDNFVNNLNYLNSNKLNNINNNLNTLNRSNISNKHLNNKEFIVNEKHNEEKIIINNIKEMNFNNKPKKTNFKSSIPSNLNPYTNNCNYENTIKEKIKPIKSIVNNKISSNNTHLPYITNNHKELITNDYFSKPNIYKELLIKIHNIASFDLNRHILVIANTKGNISLYNTNNLDTPYKEFNLEKIIKKIKIIKNVPGDLNIFIQYFNDNSSMLSFEENKIKIRCYSFESKDEDSDYKNYFSNIYENNIILYDFHTNEQIDNMELDDKINKLIMYGKDKILVSSSSNNIYVIGIQNRKLSLLDQFDNFGNINFMKNFYQNQNIILLGSNNGKLSVIDINNKTIKNEINFGYTSIKDFLIFISMGHDLINCLAFDGDVLYFGQIDNKEFKKIGYLNMIEGTELKILNYSENNIDILYSCSEGIGFMSLKSN